MKKDSTPKASKTNAADHPKVAAAAVDKPAGEPEEQLDEKVLRLMEQDRAEKARFKHLHINFRENRFGPLVFAVLFAGIGAFFIFNSSAASEKPAPVASVKMWLVPAAQTATVGSMSTLEIWEDSANEPVNAVQASLSFPADRVAYSGVDAAGSSFGVSAQSTAEGGKVTIVRGSTEPLRGKQLVARVNFKMQARGTVKIDLTNQSQILRSSDNINILSGRTGTQYNVR